MFILTLLVDTSYYIVFCFSSVQFSRSAVSDSLRPHGLYKGECVAVALQSFPKTVFIIESLKAAVCSSNS